MNLEDVKNRFKEVQVTDLFFTKKEVKELPKIIRENELIMYATSGFWEGNTYLIVCTNIRIIFLDKGMIYGLKKVEIPIEKINSISYKTGLVFGEITVYHGSSSMKIKQIMKQTVEVMANAINQEIDSLKEQNNVVNNTTSSNSIADELLKYKELLDMGAIDSEEYEIFKNKLLNK